MSDLSIVLGAAQKWADELANYIIDDATKRGDDEDAKRYSDELDTVHAAIEALKAEGGRSPDPSPVSYAPCITGKVEIEGAVSEFLIPLDNDSVRYSQWGAGNMALWPRVDLLEGMADVARDWYADNRQEADEE